MPNRRLLQLKALLSFMFDALCDGAVSRLSESAFVFLLSRRAPRRQQLRAMPRRAFQREFLL
jgi:hypothetical protein